MNKQLEDFVNKTLIPIERNQVNDGFFYVSLEGSYNYPPREVVMIKKRDRDFNVEWSLPNNENPGDWCSYQGKLGKGYRSRKITLESLASLLFHDGLREKLYIAEHEGQAETLQFIQSVSIADYIFNDPPEYFTHIYENLPRSLNVEKARLIRDVSAWNVDTAWNFANTFTEKMLQETLFHSQRQGYVIPEIYFDAFELAQKCKLWYCTEHKANEERGMNPLSDRKTYNLQESIKEIVINDVNSHLIGEAVIACMASYPSNIWKAAQRVRGQYAKNRIQQLENESDFLKQIDDFNFRQRVLQAFGKQELDQQTQYLIKALNK
ncbi:MAG: hypothetical protein HN916_16740 [Anaerolineae bacterium]|jgi:hypothetical protein|nr:hypothetical protein [Anaerolineae bacterium]